MLVYSRSSKEARLADRVSKKEEEELSEKEEGNRTQPCGSLHFQRQWDDNHGRLCETSDLARLRLKDTVLISPWRDQFEGTSKDPGGGGGDWAQGSSGRVGRSGSLGVHKVEPTGFIAD